MTVKMNIVKIGVEPILVTQPDGAQFYDGTGWEFDGNGIEGETVGVQIDIASEPLFCGYTVSELHEIWANARIEP